MAGRNNGRGRTGVRRPCLAKAVGEGSGENHPCTLDAAELFVSYGE